MSKDAEYRSFAASCLEIANKTSDTASKARLLATAEAWLDLAERRIRLVSASRSEPATTNLRLTCRQGRDEKSVTILSAVRTANADSVSVGLAVPTVGNVPLPTR
jgi:Tfp pilus assembly protein PilX